MFYLRYIAAELRRRRGRTILTALGLAVGVGLVVAVSALSAGLDDAQEEILEPLTGVGTDMSVRRPISIGGDGTDAGGPGGFPELSEKERRQLERENGGGRFGFDRLDEQGEPGERFSNQSFVTQDLSFAERKVRQAAELADVEEAAGGLVLSALEVSGEIPEGPVRVGPGGGGRPGGPESIDVDQFTVGGVDLAKPDLALVTRDQITDGDYLGERGRQAVVSTSHAVDQGIEVGDQIDVGEQRFEVVGISSPPLGADSADVYVSLDRLQRMSDREGRVNVMQVRADDASDVGTVTRQIEAELAGAEVTTSSELADRVSGSLVDAKNLSNTLGIALSAVALIAAFLIASMLSLSSVSKRVREIGTLKAVGWPSRLVVRQISGESIAQGALGGALGILIGIAAAALISALGISLTASVAAEAAGGGAFVGGPGGGGFGQGQVASGEGSVTLSAPVDPALLLAAVGLALLGGLIAGVAGSMRAARLRPAEALRSVE